MSDCIMSDPIVKAAQKHLSVAYKPEGVPSMTASYYSSWAENNDYEKHLNKNLYKGPAIAAKAVADFFSDPQREKVKILDVAAGTGFVGEYLKEYGFVNVDALDASEGMLKRARDKGIYTNMIRAYVDEKELPILEDTYDCITTSGGFGEGHIPWFGLDQLLRVVKPGGLICIVMREAYLNQHGQCEGKLEPHMDELAKQGCWERLARVTEPNYCFDLNGLVFKYKVLPGKYDKKKKGSSENGVNVNVS